MLEEKIIYCIVERFGRREVCKLADCLWFNELKPSNQVLTTNNLLADLLIYQTFSRNTQKEQIHQTISPLNFPVIQYKMCLISYVNFQWTIMMLIQLNLMMQEYHKLVYILCSHPMDYRIHGPLRYSCMNTAIVLMASYHTKRWW